MKKRYFVRVGYVIVFGLLVFAVYFLLNGSGKPLSIQALDSLDDLSSYKEGSYSKYLANYGDKERPQARVRLEGEHYSGVEGDSPAIVSDYEGLVGVAVATGESGSITWTFRVESEGLYNMAIRYYPIEGKSSEIERELLINGDVPFRGADTLIFHRNWGNELDHIERDNRGNDLRPRQVETPVWQTMSFRDQEGFHDKPYQFYFEQGVNTVTFQALREPMLIDYIELYQEDDVPDYAAVKRGYKEQGYRTAKDVLIKVQAEHAKSKSSPMLYPITDHTSPSTEPYDVAQIRINTIGGNNWRLPGQWISWEVDVPEDGLYQIALKSKQNLLRGIYSNRKLYIDGQIPFREMEHLTFNYDADWQMTVLGDDDEPYYFYLSKGRHELKLEISLGGIAEFVNTVESSVLELNHMYRKILTITSATPDPFRDYNLERRIPEMTEVFVRQSQILLTVAEMLKEETGETSDKTAVLNTMAVQLQDMADRPETVAERLAQYMTNVGSLGTWILTVREMPLELDYLIVASPEQKLPQAKPSLLAKVSHEIKAYVQSYRTDYNSIGNIARDQKSVTVWIGTGRDQAQVLKAMIDDTFTAHTGIEVNLKLVNMGVLLPASLAGQGPDVAMQIGNNIPVNYGMRNAAADLRQFPDFEEVADRFRDSALVPYSYNSGVYALPEQQVFSMLFYRKDVLAELGLEVPDTWEDVYNMIPELQKNHMQFALPIEDVNNAQAQLGPNQTFAMLLFQNGGEFYKDEGQASSFDDQIAMNAFKQWTDFYSSYKFPVQFDFANRFRVGEMPIGIADYTMYNMLSVFAPEIRGLWGFTVVPGTVHEDGSMSRDVAGEGSGVMMMKNTSHADEAWSFMKWWTSKETQIRFGREMEGLMGPAARYPTANIEALKELPWPVQDYNNLERQWEWVNGIPEVPGGYFTGRHLNNAFRTVINEGENPRETLYDYTLKINQEIDVKRDEFNLPN